MPRWLAVLFAAIMLGVCAAAGWCTVERVRLEAQLADAALMLDTSRQRERKQQYEYDQVAEELPQVQADVAQTQPLADEATTNETALRAQRKQLRAEAKQQESDLTAATEALEQARTEAVAAAEALRTEIAALQTLIEQAEAALAANE